MCTEVDNSGMSYNSDFNSEDEEAELGLYAQLYFEANPDSTVTYENEIGLGPTGGMNGINSTDSNKEDASAGTNNEPASAGPEPLSIVLGKNDLVNSRHSNNEIYEHLSSSSTNITEVVRDACTGKSTIETNQQDACTGKSTIETNQEKDIIQDKDPLPSVSHVQVAPHLSFHQKALKQSELPGCDVTRDISSISYSVTINNKSSISKPGRTVIQTQRDKQMITSGNSSTAIAFLAASRERVSSICSEGSIPGSLPLDELYCNIPPPDDNTELELHDRLTMFEQDKQDQPQYRKEEESRKRKRSDNEDDPEESRCELLLNINNTKKMKEDEVKQKRIESESSESDTGDLYVLEPPCPKDFETLTLISTTPSDSENEDRTITIKEKSSKMPNKDKPLITNKTPTKIPSKFVKKTSDVIVIDGNDTIDLDSDTNSFTDSEFIMPNASMGTDLIIGIHEELTPFVNRITKNNDTTTTRNTNQCTSTIKKPTKAKKRTHSGSFKHSLDFNRGREDSIRVPSCKKWTQEMVNFYDSDVSDDIDVTSIHEQQSNIRSAWHIINEDRYVNNSRRYYQRQERCTLCRQLGHQRSKCDRVQRCHLCSKSSHFKRFHCPQNCCFGCGGRYHAFCWEASYSAWCRFCGYEGHGERICPAPWRKYHLTTSGLHAQSPGSAPSWKQYCSVCAKKGHFGFECPQKYSINGYLPVPQLTFSPPEEEEPRFESMVTTTNNEEPDGDMYDDSGGRDTNSTESTSPKKNRDWLVIPCTKKQKGFLLNRSPPTLKHIQRETGAKVKIQDLRKSKKCQICIIGTTEAQAQVKEMVVKKMLKYNQLLLPEQKIDKMLTDSANQNSIWCSKLHSNLNRNKAIAVSEISKQIIKVRTLGVSSNIKQELCRLQDFQWNITMGMMPYEEDYVRKISKDLKSVCQAVAHVSGVPTLHRLLAEIEGFQESKLPRKFLQHVCEEIGAVWSPSLENLESVLESAAKYLNFSPGTEMVNKNNEVPVYESQSSEACASQNNEVLVCANQNVISKSQQQNQQASRVASVKRTRDCSARQAGELQQQQLTDKSVMRPLKRMLVDIAFSKTTETVKSKKKRKNLRKKIKKRTNDTAKPDMNEVAVGNISTKDNKNVAGALENQGINEEITTKTQVKVTTDLEMAAETSAKEIKAHDEIKTKEKAAKVTKKKKRGAEDSKAEVKGAKGTQKKKRVAEVKSKKGTKNKGAEETRTEIKFVKVITNKKKATDEVRTEAKTVKVTKKKKKGAAVVSKKVKKTSPGKPTLSKSSAAESKPTDVNTVFVGGNKEKDVAVIGTKMMMSSSIASSTSSSIPSATSSNNPTATSSSIPSSSGGNATESNPSSGDGKTMENVTIVASINKSNEKEAIIVSKKFNESPDPTNPNNSSSAECTSTNYFPSPAEGKRTTKDKLQLVKRTIKSKKSASVVNKKSGTSNLGTLLSWPTKRFSWGLVPGSKASEMMMMMMMRNSKGIATSINSSSAERTSTSVITHANPGPAEGIRTKDKVRAVKGATKKRKIAVKVSKKGKKSPGKTTLDNSSLAECITITVDNNPSPVESNGTNDKILPVKVAKKKKCAVKVCKKVKKSLGKAILSNPSSAECTLITIDGNSSSVESNNTNDKALPVTVAKKKRKKGAALTSKKGKKTPGKETEKNPNTRGKAITKKPNATEAQKNPNATDKETQKNPSERATQKKTKICKAIKKNPTKSKVTQKNPDTAHKGTQKNPDTTDKGTQKNLSATGKADQNYLGGSTVKDVTNESERSVAVKEDGMFTITI